MAAVKTPELSADQIAERARVLALRALARRRTERRLALRVRLLHMGRPW